MARGERLKAQGTRKDAILDEATRLFAERGYEGTSMADLAENVGLRKASLFHHFASKEVLRRAVVDRLIQRVSHALEEASNAAQGQGGEAFSKRVDSISDAVVRVLGEQPYAARLLLREAMEWDAKSKDNLGEALTKSLDASERFLTDAQRAGVCTQCDPKQLVATLMGLHLVPFAVGGVMERFMGQTPWTEPFVAARCNAVRDQVRTLLARR
jgi:TetR/AcrR family transcriptional regulator